MKLLYFGSNIYSALILEYILTNKSTFDIDDISIVTQPNQPQGREKIVTANEFSKHITKISPGILQFKPKQIKEEYLHILEMSKPDIIIVCAYGQILPENLLKFPKFKCYNIHFSKLPLWRGACPVPMTIRFGNPAYVSLQIMSYGLDEGIVVVEKSCLEFETDRDTATILKLKMVKTTCELLHDNWEKMIDIDFIGKIQDPTNATYCFESDLNTKSCKINWGLDNISIDRFIRSCADEPCAWTIYNGTRYKIFNCNYITNQESDLIFKDLDITEQSPDIDNPIFFKSKRNLYAKCGIGYIKILEIQKDGGKRMLSQNIQI